MHAPCVMTLLQLSRLTPYWPHCCMRLWHWRKGDANTSDTVLHIVRATGHQRGASIMPQRPGRTAMVLRQLSPTRLTAAPAATADTTQAAMTVWVVMAQAAATPPSVTRIAPPDQAVPIIGGRGHRTNDDTVSRPTRMAMPLYLVVAIGDRLLMLSVATGMWATSARPSLMAKRMLGTTTSPMLHRRQQPRRRRQRRIAAVASNQRLQSLQRRPLRYRDCASRLRPWSSGY